MYGKHTLWKWFQESEPSLVHSESLGMAQRAKLKHSLLRLLKEGQYLQKGALSFICEQFLCQTHTLVLSSFQINDCFVADVATLTFMHYGAVPAPTWKAKGCTLSFLPQWNSLKV